MSTYVFFFGNTPDLSRSELQYVLARLGIKEKLQTLSLRIDALKISSSLDTELLLLMLGGVVKIGLLKKILLEITPSTVAQLINENGKSGKQTFGLSFYTPAPFTLVHFSQMIKNQLALMGVKSRFVLPNEGTVLSSVVVEKQNVIEFSFVEKEEQWFAIQTIGVQPFASWSKRDFGRPAADPSKGMLPPKIARMMINLALQDKNPHTQTVLDPFCGMGTILGEALLLGVEKCFGMDISVQSLAGARKNLSWLRSEFESFDGAYELVEGDATHAGKFFDVETIDCIVTEPYLGPAFEKRGKEVFLKNKKLTAEKLRNIGRGLEKLYRGVLKEWYPLLRKNGRVVIALPVFAPPNKKEDDFVVKNIVDSCEKLGYTLSNSHFLYSREHAFVKRSICQFTKI